VTISAGVATVPTDFKALKFARFAGSPVTPLTWVSPDELYRQYPNRATITTPCLISREGLSFIFGPTSSDGTLNGIYYAKKDPLRTTDPSWYVTNAPEVLLYGSLLESAPFIHDDPRLAVWRELYNDAIATLNVENENAETSFGPLYQHAL